MLQQEIFHRTSYPRSALSLVANSNSCGYDLDARSIWKTGGICINIHHSIIGKSVKNLQSVAPELGLTFARTLANDIVGVLLRRHSITEISAYIGTMGGRSPGNFWLRSAACVCTNQVCREVGVLKFACSMSLCLITVCC